MKASIELNKSVRAKDFLNRWFGYTGFNSSANTKEELDVKIAKRLKAINRKGVITYYE